MTQIQTRSMSQGIDLEQGLVRSQAVAGALFFLFLLLHLSNILLAPLGVEVFNGYQRSVRAVYQYPVIELVIVLIPIVVHAVAGVSLYFLRRGKKGSTFPEGKTAYMGGCFPVTGYRRSRDCCQGAFLFLWRFPGI